MIECPAATCRASILVYTKGSAIVSSKPPHRFRHRSILNAAGNWKSQLSELVQEACKANYLGSSRGAAICLRIALEQVVNIKLLGANWLRPDLFPFLKDAIEDAIEIEKLTESNRSKELAIKIKNLGDSAAHPNMTGSVLVTPSAVDLAIIDMESLMEKVRVV